MSAIIEKPLANPFHFVAEAQSDEVRYGSKPVLRDWYFNQLKEWEDKTPYYCAAQVLDPQRLQFHVNQQEGVLLKLINCDGHPLQAWTPTSVITLAGNTEPYSGSDQQLYTHYFKFNFAEQFAPDFDPADFDPFDFYTGAAGTQSFGIYWLLLEITLPDTTKQYEISEPIDIRWIYPGSVFIETANDTNDYNAIFEQTNCTFGLRIPGAVLFDNIDSEDTDYKDQQGKVTKLYGSAGWTSLLSVVQVPPYMLIKINAAMVMDRIKIDGVRYVKDIGAKWELSKEGVLKMASITLRDADPGRALFTFTPDPLTLFTVPSYPFAIGSILIGEGFANRLIESGGRVVDNNAGRDALIDDLNDRANSFDLNGVFSLSAGKIIYTNVTGENYNTAFATVFINPVSIVLDIPSTDYTVAMNFRGGFFVIDWGDGTVQSKAALMAPITYDHFYPSSTSVTIRVFGYYNLFLIGEASIVSLSGKFPAQLQVLGIGGDGPTTGPTTFDTTMLTECVNVLQSLTISNTQVTNINGFRSRNFKALTFLNLTNNKLSAAQVNNGILAGVRDYATNNNLLSGSLYIHNQTPPAPLTLAGMNSKTILQSKGWTISND